MRQLSSVDALLAVLAVSAGALALNVTTGAALGGSPGASESARAVMSVSAASPRAIRGGNADIAIASAATGKPKPTAPFGTTIGTGDREANAIKR
jgi:hypothetical protein